LEPWAQVPITLRSFSMWAFLLSTWALAARIPAENTILFMIPMTITGGSRDPGFEYGVVLAKTAGRAALRMADAPALPFDFSSFYKTVNGYAAELAGLIDQSRENTALVNEIIKENHYSNAGDPTVRLLTPVIPGRSPFSQLFLSPKCAERSRKSDQPTVRQPCQNMGYRRPCRIM